MTQSRNVLYVVLGVLAILAIPLVLTLLNPTAHLNGGAGGGWDWEPGDFATMGALLLLTGLAINYALHKITNPLYRGITVAGIVAVLLVLWVELAVDGVSQLMAYLFT